MKVSISTNNCYIWPPIDGNQPQSCLIYKFGETKLWNRKTGHLNLIRMRKIIAEKYITGIPDLNIEEGKFIETARLGSKPRCHIRRFNILPLIVLLNYFIWILWDLCKLRVLEVRYMFLYVLITTLYTPERSFFMKV